MGDETEERVPGVSIIYIHKSLDTAAPRTGNHLGQGAFLPCSGCEMLKAGFEESSGLLVHVRI